MDGENLTITERGQSLVLLALMLFVLLWMLALIIDGGMAYAQRRSAQNAADAGALAGASELCKQSDDQTIYDKAYAFSVTKNGATTADISIDHENWAVDVTAHISYPTFIASILNQPVMSVSAHASAGCKKACSSVNVLPVAWACRAADGSVTNDCQAEKDSLNPNTPFILMDSDGLPCMDSSGNPPNGLHCDIDDDGKDEIDVDPGGGNRGWLNLDGGQCGNDPRVWMANGYNGELRIHSWIKGCPGTAGSSFKGAERWVGYIMVLPVYDYPCVKSSNNLPEIDCPEYYHFTAQPPDYMVDITRPAQGGKNWFHIIKFSQFRLSCIQQGKKVEAYDPAIESMIFRGKEGDYCPGVKAFLDHNLSYNPSQLKSIEGYFVSDYNPDFTGACGEYDGEGAPTIYLNR